MNIEALAQPKNYEYKALSNLPANPALLEIKNQTENSVDIWMTGEVGWDITADAAIAVLKSVDGDDVTVNIYIDSVGGSVFEGYAIGNFIGGMKATVNVKVVALAASIASFIAVKADRVEMPENSFMMIHQAWGVAVGTAKEMHNTATLIEKMNDQLEGAYKSKRAKTLGSEDGENFAELMANDTWLTSVEAVALGLADEVVEDTEMFNSTNSKEILARINAPENVLEKISAKVESIKSEVEIELEAGVKIAGEDEIKNIDSDAVEEIEEVLSDSEITAINAACELFDMQDKAGEFISAKSSIQDVKKALWKAKTLQEEENETDPIIEVREIEEEDAYHNRAEKIRNSYKDALR